MREMNRCRAAAVCLAAIVTVLLAASPASADGYRVTGEVQGSICSGWVIEICSMKQIDAVIEDGQLHYTADSYRSVSETHDGRCWIDVDWGAPRFLTYRSGPRHEISSYEELDTPDFITFPCEPL